MIPPHHAPQRLLPAALALLLVAACGGPGSTPEPAAAEPAPSATDAQPSSAEPAPVDASAVSSSGTFTERADSESAAPEPAAPGGSAPPPPADEEPELAAEPTTTEAEPELQPEAAAPEPPQVVGPALTDDIVLARVNGVDLTLSHALDKFLSSHGGHSLLVRGEPAVRELAARLVEEQVFLEEAFALELEQDPAVEIAIEEFRRKSAEMHFWRREVEEAQLVSDEEVDAFYDRTEAAASIVLIETATRAEAEALLARVEAGEPIRELAAEHSTHESASFGGELGLVRMGQLGAELDAAVFDLRVPGERTAVIDTESGAVFAELIERMENQERPPREQALPDIRKILDGQARDRRKNEIMARFEEAAQVELDESLLTRAALLGELPDDTVVARAAGDELTLGGLRELHDIERMRAAPEKDVDAAVLDFATKWTERKAIRRGVERSGLLDDPEVLSETASFETDALLAQLHKEYVYAGATVDEAAVRAYYDAHVEDQFTEVDELRLAYLVTETVEEARAALDRLAAGESFAALAREVSIDPASQAHGGRMGWITPGQILPAVEAVAFELEVGARSAPIETEVGVFVLELMERKDGRQLPYTAAWRKSHQGALRELQARQRAVWVERLRERADVELDEAGIERAVAWLEAQALMREAAEAAEAELAPATDPSASPQTSPHSTPGGNS